MSIYRSLFAATAALAVAATVAAQVPKPLSKSESVTVKATIEAINPTDRTVTLKGPQGSLVVVQADKRVKRFDKLKVGDEVTATYTESIVVRVRKPGEAAPLKEASGINLREGKPGATATQEETMSVTIENIDLAAPSVTVKGPEGRVASFRVRDIKNLEGLKVGDTVDITYTRALLLKADAVSK